MLSLKILTPNSFYNVCLRHHESIDVCDISQLGFIRMIFIDGNSKEDPLQTTELHEKISGENIFKHFMFSFCKWISPINNFGHRHRPHTSHELWKHSLIWLCNKHSAFHFLSLTTVLFPWRPYVHKRSTRIFNMYWVFCNICKFGLHYAFSHRLFRYSIHENDAHYWKLMLHREVRQLCRGKYFFSSSNRGVSSEKQFTPKITRLLMLLSSQILQLN